MGFFWTYVLSSLKDPLHQAIRYHDLERVKALLKDKPDLVFRKDKYYDATPLHYAALFGHKGTAEFLLANKADVNAKDKDSNTSLHLLVHGATTLRESAGHKDVAELLLASKADVNAKNHAGMTPLHLAALSCFNDVARSVAKLMVANKADVNAKDDFGGTPLH
jgi:ankyrin repeat protein